jgi:hypothetical protein
MADYYEPIIRNGVQVGERLVPDTSGLVIRRRYRLSEWIDALTDAELDVILDYVHGASGTANQQRAARRVWEYWRAHNLVDFNLPKTIAVVTWLVNNSGGVWTAQRATALAG